MIVPSSSDGYRLTGTWLSGSSVYKDTEPHCVIMLGSLLVISFPYEKGK